MGIKVRQKDVETLCKRLLGTQNTVWFAGSVLSTLGKLESREVWCNDGLRESDIECGL